MSEDVFKVDEIVDVQQRILAALSQGPDDIGVKIAALRSAADLLQNAATMAILTAQYRSIVTPRT